MVSRANDGKKARCTCDVTARYVEHQNGARRDLGVPQYMSSDCQVGFGNRVLAEQEAAECEAYLDGTVVYDDQY